MVKLLVRRLITTHCLNQVQLPSLVYHCRVTEYEYKTHQGLFQGEGGGGGASRSLATPSKLVDLDICMLPNQFELPHI